MDEMAKKIQQAATELDFYMLFEEDTYAPGDVLVFGNPRRYEAAVKCGQENWLITNTSPKWGQLRHWHQVVERMWAERNIADFEVWEATRQERLW